MQYTKPLPIPDGESEPYWQSARDHRLKLQRCNSCQSFIFYPRTICPKCFGADLIWQPISGHGQVYSFAIQRVPISAAYKDSLPYVLVLVDLAEGPRMLGTVLNCAPEEVRIGLEVEVTYQDITAEFTLPQFRLTDSGMVN